MNKNVSLLFQHKGEVLGVFDYLFEDVDDDLTVDCLPECILYGCFFDESKWAEWNITNIEDMVFLLNGNQLNDNDKIQDITGTITCDIKDNG